MSHWGAAVCPVQPSPVPWAEHPSLSPGAFHWAGSCLCTPGAAPELLPSPEMVVLLEEWAECAELWCSEVPSSASSSSVLSGGAHAGTRLEPLPLSFRLSNCSCETPTALPDTLEG